MSIFFLLIFIFTLFYFTILYWFCHTLTWIHHRCTWVPNPEPSSHLPPHIISLDHPLAPAPSILYPISNIVFLPGESPWTEEPGRPQSVGHRESDMTEQLSTAKHSIHLSNALLSTCLEANAVTPLLCALWICLEMRFIVYFWSFLFVLSFTDLLYCFSTSIYFSFNLCYFLPLINFGLCSSFWVSVKWKIRLFIWSLCFFLMLVFLAITPKKISKVY